MSTLHDARTEIERENAELRKDAARLDALERLVLEQPYQQLVLHHGRPFGLFIAGLGLSNTGRSLRQAIDDTMR
jgi:hypothetical protein